MQLAVDVLSVIDAGDGVVVVAGELDAATAGQLTRRLSAPPPPRVIDLSGVTFIDASGLRVLVDAATTPPAGVVCAHPPARLFGSARSPD